MTSSLLSQFSFWMPVIYFVLGQKRLRVFPGISHRSSTFFSGVPTALETFLGNSRYREFFTGTFHRRQVFFGTEVINLSGCSLPPASGVRPVQAVPRDGSAAYTR